jgi:hypothetical protein
VILLLALALQAPPEDVRKMPLLPPGPGNPRNSEGDFLSIADGLLMFAYTRFTGKSDGDHAEAEIVARFSGDHGRTWTPKDVPVVPREGKMNVMSVSLLKMANGDVGVFYLRKDSTEQCRMFLRRSADEAKNFGDPVLCIPEDGYFVVNNDRVVRLKSGRLVVPAARHCRTGEKHSAKGVALCSLSDDDGAAWRMSKTALEGPGNAGLQEPLVVELKDGRLLMLCRTDQGSQYRSFSADGGETWSAAEPSSLRSPLSPASVARIPQTGHLLAVWNDHSSVDEARRGKRTPFTVAVSKDEGETWGNRKTLDDDPDGWFCYTAIEFVNERVLLAHCAGDSKVGRLNRTRITTFDVQWLYR